MRLPVDLDQLVELVRQLRYWLCTAGHPTIRGVEEEIQGQSLGLVTNELQDRAVETRNHDVGIVGRLAQGELRRVERHVHPWAVAQVGVQPDEARLCGLAHICSQGRSWTPSSAGRS